MSSTDAAPLSQALLAASQSASYAFVVVRGLSGAASKFFSLILILSPLPIILYALAPVLVFLQLAFSIVVLLPYHTFLYLVDVLYPLYVFFGVACIAGALIGLSGRILAAILTAVVLDIGDDDKRRSSRILASRL
jgi:hypothetical protein